MTDDGLPLTELMKAGGKDFPRNMAEAVVQLLTDVDGPFGAGRHERSGRRSAA